MENKFSHQIVLQNNILAISGELNFATVVPLWNDSLPLLAQCQTLSYDFANVTSSNSGGVVLLLEWVKYAKRHKKEIRFSHIPLQLQSIIRVSGLEKIFPS